MNSPSKFEDICPYCEIMLRADRLSEHIKLRCTKAPRELVATRAQKTQPGLKRKAKSIKKRPQTSTSGRLTKDYETGLQKAAYARYVRNQRDAMPD
jgi:hypothetical protein